MAFKLPSRKEKKEKERLNRIIFSVLVALIMIASIVGFALEFRYDSLENKNIHEVKIFDKKIQVETFHSKNETDDVMLYFTPHIDVFLNKKYYFYSHNKLREKSIRLLLYLTYFSLLNEACLNESLSEEEVNEEKVEREVKEEKEAEEKEIDVLNASICNEILPLKTCDDNFIVFEYSNVSAIKRKRNCIIISGNETTIDKSIDRFLYELFSIKSK